MLATRRCLTCKAELVAGSRTTATTCASCGRGAPSPLPVARPPDGVGAASGDPISSNVAAWAGQAGDDPHPLQIDTQKHDDGMEAVACWAARVSWLWSVMIISTLSRTSSAANTGSRSDSPAAYRASKTRFWPWIQPRSFSAARNVTLATSSKEARSKLSIPTRATLPDGCAQVASGAAKAPASAVVRRRRRSMPGR
jgi:hypothetical protein